jgi:hypothetical protein
MAAPRWRTAFDAVERRVGEPLESAVATPEFASLLGLAARAQRRASRTVEEGLSWWLHRWGIPSRSDVRDVKRAVTRVEQSLRALSHELEERHDQTGVG